MEKKISIIVPIFNEEANLDKFYKELKASLPTSYDFEILFINDGSTDRSKQKLAKLAKTDKKVRVVNFTRNFGKEAATSAGLNLCSGDAALMIDCDLQHPPKLISQFIKSWEAGIPVVVGVRTNGSGDGFIKKVGSSLFYKIINRISETRMVPNSTDFRLLDRRVIDEFNRLNEHNRISRGLVDWLGFEQEFITFESPKRTGGSANYSTAKLFRLAFNSMISLSLFPLRLAGYLGVFIILVSTVMGSIVLVSKYILKNPWGLSITGTGMLALILVFLIGIVLISLGLISLYIANIHQETINRPLYVVRDKENFKDGK